MRFTLSWLKDHLDTDEPVDKLADRLTMIGLEVEHLEDRAKALAPFSIARVIAASSSDDAGDRRPRCGRRPSATTSPAFSGQCSAWPCGR